VDDNPAGTGQVDPLRHPDAVAGHPLVIAAARLATELLAPVAEEVDQSVVPPSHLAAIGAAGLLAPTAPAEVGGGGAPAAVGRAVTELLACACGATWFVVTQNGTPVRTLAVSDNRELRAQWLRPLASGSALAGIALAQLRRPGPPAVSGSFEAGGWSVSGNVPWLTSWGLADVVLLGFRDGADAVFALVPAADQPGFVGGAPLPLAAMQAASTVSVRLNDYVVPETHVVERLPYEHWAERDAANTANVTPAVFGLLRAVLTRLRAEAERRDEAPMFALAERLGAEAAGLRTAAYALIDDVPAGERMADRLALRASALELVTVATAGLVAAGAGASMSLRHPAQRWAREALFHLIQAQTPAVRAATLERFAARRG
jgi:alkylation response protein AidB-like acyl-CoA dehydrogenase